MKYILSFLCIVGIVLVFVFCGTASSHDGLSNESYLRIHIRANSNSQQDQSVKYKVKDAVVEALIPILADCQTKQDALCAIGKNFSLVEQTADNILQQNGFLYSSKAIITNEHFPTRVYGDLTLEEGDYDALILNLGTGTGDNWWCVVYPAFCFTQTKKSDNLVYISQIWEIIKNVMKW